MVPNGWIQATLGDLVHKSAFGPRFTSELYSKDGAIGTIRTTDLYNDGEINYATIPYADLDVSEYEEHVLNEGDLLITRSGTCGIPCIFTEQEKPIIAGAFLIRFQLNERVNSKFLHEVLKSSPVQSSIKRMAAGGVQKNLTGTSLKKLHLALPPLPEQRKIAKILSTWDKAISTTEKLIETSKQQKKALMQQLLTGKKRLVNPETGKAFEREWEEVKLAELCKIGTGKKDANDGSPSGKYPFFTCAKRPILSSSYSYDFEALLIAGNGVIGTTHYYNGKFEAYQRTYILSEFRAVFVAYLHHWINFYLKRGVDREKQHGAMPYIKVGMLQNFKVKLGSYSEQQKIASVLTAADKEIEVLEAKLAHFKQEKKALMQQLLTGKRRVKVADMEVA
ncbi:restriction endonuclease subunit S [Vibrio breoganii]